MFFDIDNLDRLEQIGFFDEVVIHEMGHVLGFGTLWKFGRDLLQGGAPDPRFTGPLAIAAYADLGGRGHRTSRGEPGERRQPGLDLKGRERLIRPPFFPRMFVP